VKIRKARDNKFNFQSHSDDYAVAQQNMVFQDTIMQSNYNEPLQHQDKTFKVHDETDASLASFLARPVLIATHSWDVGTDVNQVYDPWSLFYSNSKVQKKVDGFYLQRFDLKIKLLINGSPFYYGKCLASYNPLGQQDGIDELSNTSFHKLITRSQRNHVVLDSCLSIGGEISCPYFHPHAYQEISGAFRDMGTLSLDSFTPLNNSNGSNSTVYIQIYAWAENVVLSVPTTDLHDNVVLVSHSDEYSTNKRVAKKSNAVNSADGFFTKVVPKITEYALATTSFISSVAGLGVVLGFSRPPVLDKQVFVKNQVYGNMANVDAPECLHKLTLDSKQELTIDPRTVGIEPIDELQISNIISRSSYLTQFQWSPSDAPGDLIWSTRVTPMQVGIENVSTGSTRFTPTLLSYVSQLFNWWTGDIEYSFSIVASNYHKGRLLIVYDPSPPNVSTVPDSNSVYTRVIDISEVKDFEIRVAYSQGVPYMRVLTNRDCATAIYPTNFGQTYGGLISSTLPNSQLGSNGTLSVFVLNPLLNPSSSDTGIPSVLVSSKACDNFKFAGVRNMNEYLVGFTLPNVPILLDSHSLESPEDVIKTNTISTAADVDVYPLVWFGESFESLRSLLKRYNYYLSYYPTDSDVWGASPTLLTEASSWTMIRSNIPQYLGYDPTGFAGTGTSKYFPGRLTTLGYIMPMFVGMRGGIRYKYGLTSLGGEQQTGVMSVYRKPDTGSYYQSNLVSVSASGVVNPSIRNFEVPQSSSGAIVTNLVIQPVAEVELPYYSPSRFSYIRGCVPGPSDTFPARVDPSRDKYSGYYSDSHAVNITVPASGTLANRSLALDAYVGVGEDFQLFWLLSAPASFGVFSGTA